MFRRTHFIQSAICAAAVFFNAQGPAQAAGYWILDQATSNYGRGGASLVQPGDATAVYANPAALAGLRGFHFIIGANMIKDGRQFQRDDLLTVDGQPYEVQFEDLAFQKSSFDLETNSAGPAPSPHLFLAYNFESIGLPELSIGTGVWGPPRADLVMSETGPQRYSTIASYNIQAHDAFAAAYELPWKKMRLGVTMHGITQIIDTELALNAPLPCGLSAQEDRRCDVLVAAVATEHFIPIATFAYSMELIEGLEFMASYQTSYDLDAVGEATLKTGETIQGFATFEGNDIGVQTTLPSVIKGALRYTAPKYNVELATTFENWGVHQDIAFDASQIFVKSNGSIDIPCSTPNADPAQGCPVGTIQLRPRLQNTYSVRLGGDYQLVEDTLLLRAGTYFESSAAQKQFLDMSNFDSNKIGATLGAKYSIPGGLWLDLAAGYVHFMPQEIADSEVKFTDPLNPDTEGHVIANGTYESYQIIMMAALGGQWGI